MRLPHQDSRIRNAEIASDEYCLPSLGEVENITVRRASKTGILHANDVMASIR